MRTIQRYLLALVMASGLLSASNSFAVTVDPKLPNYEKTSGVSGSLKSIGSDTLNNLMTLWSEEFRSLYPSVKVEIEGKGSSTAPPALIEGTAHFGPMSRAMKPKEVATFEKKFGYKPTETRVAVDSLAVFVNKDAPIECLSLAQVDAIFSKTRKLGESAAVTTWGQLGVKGAWADKPVSLYGRNAASGTYGYFKSVALGDGDFKDTVKEQPGSSAVVQGIAADKFGIGYSGVGYKTADVKTVKLKKDASGTCYDASAENAYSGNYPLARFLYVYVNKKPNTDLDPLRREFMKFVYSQQGQKVVLKDGYYPVSAILATQDLKKLGISQDKSAH